MQLNAKHVLVELSAVIVAATVGIVAFFIVFAWPIFWKGNLMLAWGWIGWIPGLWIGHKCGGFTRTFVRNYFREASVTPRENDA